MAEVNSVKALAHYPEHMLMLPKDCPIKRKLKSNFTVSSTLKRRSDNFISIFFAKLLNLQLHWSFPGSRIRPWRIVLA